MTVKIYGHRVAAGERPGNTIEGILFARSAGLTGVETDVVLTRDLIPVLHHDMVLPNGWFIPETPARELPPGAPVLSQAVRDITRIEWILEVERPWNVAERIQQPQLIVRRILAWTEPSPGLPLVTASTTPPETLAALRSALVSASRDPTLTDALGILLISGFETLSLDDCEAVLTLKQAAIAPQYLELI